MAHTAIQKVTIRNCGCIKDAEVDLSPLHAFVGPNDSGKSTLLRAVRTATHLAVGTFTQSYTVGPTGPTGPQGWQGGPTGPTGPQGWPGGPGGATGPQEWRGGAFAAGELSPSDQPEILPFSPLLTENTVGAFISLTLASSFEYQVGTDDGQLFEFATAQGGRQLLSAIQHRPLLGKSLLWASSLANADPEHRLAELREQISPATLVRFDPDALREAAPQLLDSEGIHFANERGTGLAAVYDAIQNRDRAALVQIEDRVRELFPTVRSIGLSNPARGVKAVKVTLKDGKEIGVRDMSEGLLYFLGFAALEHCGSSLLLVEEPENGLHPARIRDIMAILRNISESAQVIIATHSPLVINEMRRNEVTVVTRDEEGTHFTPIARSAGFDDRSKVYALGELWLSYANGKDEAPLLEGGARE
jgi:predicted ATPase